MFYSDYSPRCFNRGAFFLRIAGNPANDPGRKPAPGKGLKSLYRGCVEIRAKLLFPGWPGLLMFVALKTTKYVLNH